MKSLLCILSLLMLSGCGESKGDKPPGAVDVSGKVTMDGKPLVGANVNFVNGEHISVGVTSADGTYVLTQGALPGKNKVFITKVDNSVLGDMNDVEGGMDEGQLEARAQADPEGNAKLKKAQQVPPQYSDPEQTILEVNVPESGKDDANFRLKSK